MLILAGTSFTNLPKLVAAEDAVNPAGDLTPAARIRVSTFIDALDHVDGEPFRYILQFLARHRITQDELRAYLSGNLRRAVLERNHDQGNRPAALARTAIDETLRRVQMDGKAPPAIRRICVIAPDLDLGIDPGAFDVSVLEAVQRLGLTKPGNAEVVALDFNPWVLSQVRAKSGAQNRARIRVQDLNVAAQTIDMPVNQGFELVVAINGLVRGGNLDHALAAANVARMMATGGILLTKGPPPTLPGEFELLPAGPGEGIAVYRRR